MKERRRWVEREGDKERIRWVEREGEKERRREEKGEKGGGDRKV